MEQQQIIVRRAVRYDVAMRGAFRPAPEHAGQVRYAAASGVREGWVEGDVVDVSAAGLGLVTTVFVPRRSVLLVRVMSAEAEPRLLAEVTASVQRVCMTDRRPAYLVGLSYEQLTGESEAQVKALLRSLGGEDETQGRGA